MAKGTATGEIMVRTGCKRELQFMLKSQSEICGGEPLGRTRGSKSLISHSTSTDAKRPSRIKKMRLITKDEEVVISDSVEEEKSDVVDAVMNEDHSREGTHAVKECSIVIERDIVMAKLTSRSCHVELGSGLGYEKPGRRLTRSMLKSNVDDEDHMNLGREAKDSCVSEGCKSEANGSGEDHLNAEREAKDSVDASTLVATVKEEELHEQNSVDPCLGQTQYVDKKAVSDAVDTHLRRSLGKQESDSENPVLENNIEISDLGNADDVQVDDFQSLSVTTPNKRGRLYKEFSSNAERTFRFWNT